MKIAISSTAKVLFSNFSDPFIVLAQNKDPINAFQLMKQTQVVSSLNSCSPSSLEKCNIQGKNAVVLGVGRWLLPGAPQGLWDCEDSMGGMGAWL